MPIGEFNALHEIKWDPFISLFIQGTDILHKLSLNSDKMCLVLNFALAYQAFTTRRTWDNSVTFETFIARLEALASSEFCMNSLHVDQEFFKLIEWLRHALPDVCIISSQHVVLYLFAYAHLGDIDVSETLVYHLKLSGHCFGMPKQHAW